MPTSSPSKHLWLELKPDYIDANFEQVYEYLRSFRDAANRMDDTFYVTTLDLMRQRANEIVQEESTKPISAEETPDKEKDIFSSKLLCLYLLCEPDTDNPTYKEAYFTLLFCLARCAKDSVSAEELVKLSLKVLSCEKVASVGFSWDVFKLYRTDILATKILFGCSLVDDPKRFVSLEKKGVIRANLGQLLISATNRDTLKTSSSGMVPCLSFFEDCLQILDSKSRKIKQGDANDIEKIEAFTTDFVGRQASVKPVVKKLLRYAPGQVIDVELISKGETLRLRTVDPEYEMIEGDLLISNPDALLFYKMEDFRKYLEIGDQFPVKLQTISVKGNSKFSVDIEFKDFIVFDRYKGQYGYKSCLAKLIDIVSNKNGVKQMTWWTEYGFPAYSDYEEGIEKGQYCYIQLSDTGSSSGSYRHFINAYYISPAKPGEIFDEELSKQNAITNFTYADFGPVDHDGDDVEFGVNLVRQFCRLLFFYQRTLRSAVMRYRLLCTCRILAKLVDDDIASGYIEFVAKYLENVVAFADDAYDKMTPISYSGEFDSEERINRRVDIIKILLEYGDDEEGDILDSIIEDDSDPLLVKLSKLVQSANRIQHVVSDNLLVHIKKEIISNLSIDTEKKTDLEEKKGTFYGVEDATKEFKPSFFEAPDDCDHPQDWVVFKELCAFLNSELGGTLYLGVSDAGYSQGLERDLVSLRSIGSKMYPSNLDGYKRYILDDAKKFFSNKAVLMNLTFTPVEDGKVLAIKADPWMKGVVEMDGKAFIRMDSESVEMDSRMKDEVIRKKLLSKKDNSGNVRYLQKAIEDRKMVTLHGYSSYSKTEDRLNMEPFAFDDDFQTIWCFDPSTSKCKTYKISRIGSTEVLDQGWKYASKHRQGKTDIFRMTGDKGITVRLQLDQYAKLLLCEEFPKATDMLVPDQSNTVWYLETEVRSLAGVGRFYLGLGKEHITIINSPELEEYIRHFVQENL